ncbi:MAG: glycoside hydrolase family 172 protein [Bacteroidales bacterium]|jgi:hypothetical protein
MKYRLLLLIAGFGILTTILSSCINSYRADIEKILNPGALPYLKDSKLIQVSSHDTTGGNNDMITIPADKEATILQVPGPGVITRIWFRINSNDPYFLRRILIRMYWDKEVNPSVEVPLGDFFGSGFAYRQYVTPYLGMSSGGYTCFFPMPFEQQARIVIVNETGQELKGFYYQIDYQKLEEPISTDVGYFHAYWHRDVKTDYDSNYTILKTKGHGHIVGVNMSIQSYDGKFSYLEGDEQIFVDGEKKPSIFGTGTEDYFSSGWYFSNGVYAGPYNGLVLKDDSLGRISAYRFHILDPIPFKKSIDFTIEHGENNKDIADYSSTVYWYQVEPHIKFPPILKAGLRIPLRFIPPAHIIEAGHFKFDLGGIRSKVMDMSEYGTEWSESKQLLIETGPHDIFSLFLNNLEENDYNVRIYYTRGPEYGNIDVFVGSEKVGRIEGYAPFIQPGGFLNIPDIKNFYSGIPLKFVLTGKDSLSSGYFVGLDGIKLDPKRKFIQEWNVIGPFPDKASQATSRSGIDSVYPPEIAFERGRVYKGLDGKTLKWQILKTSTDGFLSFDSLISSNQSAIFYALVYIQSPQQRLASLVIGSEDIIKVRFNLTGYKQKTERILTPDQVRHYININRGWNTLLLKIEVKKGHAGFYASIPDRENLLRYATKQYSEPESPLKQLKSRRKK